MGWQNQWLKDNFKHQCTMTAKVTGIRCKKPAVFIGQINKLVIYSCPEHAKQYSVIEWNYIKRRKRNV